MISWWWLVVVGVAAWYASAANTRDNVTRTTALMHGLTPAPRPTGPPPTAGAAFSVGFGTTAGDRVDLFTSAAHTPDHLLGVL